MNLDINLSLNAEQAQSLLLGLLSMGGFAPAAMPAAAPAATADAAAPKSSAAATPTPGAAVGDDAAGGAADLTDKLNGLLPGPTTSPSQQEEKSGGLLGFLGLNRTPAVSIAEAQKTDVGRLLVGPVMAE